MGGGSYFRVVVAIGNLRKMSFQSVRFGQGQPYLMSGYMFVMF